MIIADLFMFLTKSSIFSVLRLRISSINTSDNPRMLLNGLFKSCPRIEIKRSLSALRRSNCFSLSLSASSAVSNLIPITDETLTTRRILMGITINKVSATNNVGLLTMIE